MKLAKKSIYYRTVTRTAGTLIILAFIYPPLLLLFLPLLVVIGVYEYFYWKNYDFYMEDGDIKITSGVISRNKLDIPVRRIQNVDVNRNIIHRIFDIAEVRLETAGGTNTEASLRYLELEDAEKIKQKIRALKDRRTDSNTETEETGEEDYVLTDRNLGLLSITSGAALILAVSIMLFVAGFTAAAFYLDNTLQFMGAVIALTAGISILTAVIMLFNSVETFTKYYGFTVQRKNDTIEYEKGLITKKEGSIPKEKIQSLIIDENLFKRKLGYATLKVETAGYGAEEETARSTVLIPFDTRENIVKYAETIGNLKTNELQQIDPKAKTRYFRRYLLISGLLLLPTLGLITIGFNPLLVIIPVIVAVLSRTAAKLQWENIGYLIGENHCFIRKGFWKRRTYIVPYFRVQNLVKTESIFQRRWNQATITVDTAGSVWTNPSIPDMDAEQASKTRDKLFKKFQASIYRTR